MDWFGFIAQLVGAGGVGSLVVLWTQHLQNRRKAARGERQDEHNRAGDLFNRYERRITELERQNRECQEHHAQVSLELGSLRQTVHILELRQRERITEERKARRRKKQ